MALVLKKKSVVLLSGGLDSSVNLASAVVDSEVVLAVHFQYGQKAGSKELQSSKQLAEHYKVPFKSIELGFFKDFSSSLLTESAKVPTGNEVQLDNLNASQKTAAAVWIPNRNGVFLNVAAAYAESLGAQVVVPGFNREEAVTFADNSFDYMRALRKSFAYSTKNQVDVHCYTIQMDKGEIVKLGRELQLPFAKIWPCYFSREKWCGVCESCQRAKRAFKLHRVDVSSLFEVL